MGTSRGGDRAHGPLVIWEPTRACDLACLHCRSAIQPVRSRFELSTYEGYRLIDQVAELAPKEFVITGGDPLKRPDIYEYVDYARRRGLQPSLAPGATPLLTRESIRLLREAGAARFSIALDGPDAVTHDEYRGTPGLFDRTLDAIRCAREIGLPLAVNSSIGKHNLHSVGEMAKLVGSVGASVWNVFFLVPMLRGKAEEMITPEEAEQVFAALYAISGAAPFEIATVEGKHYRRYVLQQKSRESGIPLHGLIEAGADDGSGEVVFISHIGEVYPSGFLPLSAGNVRNRPLPAIFTTSPLFAGLRDRSLLKGRCGSCEFRSVCGGSRARAYALTGDVLGEEPLCSWIPARGADH